VPCFGETESIVWDFCCDGMKDKATVVSDIVERAGKIPVSLLINKKAALQVST